MKKVKKWHQGIRFLKVPIASRMQSRRELIDHPEFEGLATIIYLQGRWEGQQGVGELSCKELISQLKDML